MRAVGIDHAVFTVSDMERSVEWYRSLLGVEVERLEEWRRGEVIFVSLRLNAASIIDLFPGDPTPGAIDHVAVVVDDVDLDALAGELGDRVEMGPMELWGARGNGRGIYVRDPDGNRIELRVYGAGRATATS